MPARSFALALLLSLCATPAGRAAEPAGATVVLQLPPSMSPENVRRLIADLAAKGAPPRPSRCRCFLGLESENLNDLILIPSCLGSARGASAFPAEAPANRAASPAAAPIANRFENSGPDLIDPAPERIERLFVRPALEAAATVVAAWILWTVLSAIIDEKMPPPAEPGDEDEMPGSASRLDTLLPLLRNTLLIGLAVVAVIVALATLGLDIAPLLAGLGVVGIAVGFGAQSLVRDIILGLFFLMEDAFRVGEYIDTGRLRGAVEGMSLRSVRLRHQNGQVHRIPFGSGSVGYQLQPPLVSGEVQPSPGADGRYRGGARDHQACWRRADGGPGCRRRLYTAVEDVGCGRYAADRPRRSLQVYRDAIAPDLSAAPGVAPPDRRLRRRRIRFAAPNVMVQLASAAAG